LLNVSSVDNYFPSAASVGADVAVGVGVGLALLLLLL